MRLLAFPLPLLLLAVTPASASCGAGACVLHEVEAFERHAEHRPQRPRLPTSLWLGYEFEYVPQDRLRLEDRPAYQGQVRGHHDESYSFNRLHRLKASADFGERLGTDVTVPYVVRSHGHVHHHGGAVLADAWSLHGLGDIELLGRWRFHIPEERTRPSFSALAGVKLPTGRTNLFGATGQEADPTVQPGSGSWDFTLGASSLQTLQAPTLAGRDADWPLFFSATARLNRNGAKMYRRGDVFTLNGGSAYPLLERLSLTFQLNLRAAMEDGKGNTREEVEKTGGTALFATPGLELRPTPRVRAYAAVQLPLYQRVQGLQLVAPWCLVAGLGWKAF